MKSTNVNDENLDKMAADKIPDVVLLKKVYAEKSVRNRKRKWKLKHMDNLGLETGSVTSSGNNDYNDFLEDLEEDPDLRQNINVYKDANKMKVQVEDSDTEDCPQITLEEMLDDLVIAPEPSGNMDE